MQKCYTDGKPINEAPMSEQELRAWALAIDTLNQGQGSLKMEGKAVAIGEAEKARLSAIEDYIRKCSHFDLDKGMLANCD